MYWAGEDIALISRLLGHKSIAATIEYLGITQAKAETAALRHPMMRGFGVKQAKR
jgi:site-specific recombinase XerD